MMRTPYAILMAAIVVFGFLWSGAHDAVADPLSYTLADGSTVTCPQEGVYTARVVLCVKSGLRTALNVYLVKLSAYFKPIVFTVIALAVALFGVRMVMGDSQLTPKAFLFLAKIGLVLMFTNNFGDMAPAVFGIMEDVLGLVTSTMMEPSSHCAAGANPELVLWDRLDCLLGRILGFGPTVALYSGILGLVGMAMFSGTSGLMVFGLGISAIFAVLIMIFRAVYTFLLAYSAVTFLIVVSPIFIPMILFQPTMRMFNGWLDQLLSAMIEPVIMFAFMAFFVVVFEGMVFGPSSLTEILGPDFTHAMRVEQPLGPAVTLPSDPSYYGLMKEVPQALVSPVSTVLAPYLEKATNLNPIQVPKVDWGAEQVSKMTELGTNMLSMIIASYLMMTVLNHIPELSRQMVGTHSAVSIMEGKSMPMEGTINRGAYALSGRSQ